MLLNLKQIGAATPQGEKTLEFACGLDLSAVRIWGERPFLKPVEVSGVVTLRSGIFGIRYTADFVRETRCARCLVPVSLVEKREFEHVILEKPAEADGGDEHILAPDLQLDLDELVTADLLLGLDSVALCGEACCGLCPKCGQNLNSGECGCDLTVKDTRFDAVRKLMEELPD